MPFKLLAVIMTAILCWSPGLVQPQSDQEPPPQETQDSAPQEDPLLDQVREINLQDASIQEADPDEDEPDSSRLDETQDQEPQQEVSPQPSPVPADSGAEELENAGPVEYRIRAELDTKAKTVDGSVVVTYRNLSPDSIPEVRMHLYMNAFKNEKSTYFRENGPRASLPDPQEHAWGYIDIAAISIDGTDALDRMEFVQPDDANPEDQTVVRVALQHPLAPGQSLEMQMQFTVKLPQAIDRTGFVDETYLVAQWFPKLGVWESAGTRGRDEPGWNCHQFHALSEFYADFGTYNVALTVPKDYLVGATGSKIKSDEAATTKTLTFRAERVHDFAWTASPRFIRTERTFDPKEWVSEQEYQDAAVLHGLSVNDVRLHPIKLVFLMQPEHQNQLERHIEALSQAIKFFGLWYGPYPYTTLTCVDPPHRGKTIGGMEYPNLITMGTSMFPPADAEDPEEAVIHEFGHQYWYGMIASNEFEEAWLDEGFNTYATGKVLDRVYGGRYDYDFSLNQLQISGAKVLGLEPRTQLQLARKSLIENGGTDAVVRKSWSYQTPESYWQNSYDKAAAMLHQLELEVGQQTFARVMRIFATQFRFKHPSTGDFQNTLEHAVGRDFNWFFQQYVHGAKTVDYAVGLVRVTPTGGERGYLERDQGRSLVKSKDAGSDAGTLTEVVIENLGTGTYPVEIAFYFSNGREERANWDGRYPWKRFTFVGEGDLTGVSIDPNQRLFIDVNRSNNSYRLNPQNKASRRWGLRAFIGFQHLLQTIAGVLS